MSARYVLDTGVLIDYYKGRGEAWKYFEAACECTALVSYSVTSIVELWYGLRNDEEERRHEAFLTLLLELPLNGAVARRAGQLWRQFGSRGLDIPDTIIAATAIYHNSTVVTKNYRHFQPLQEAQLLRCEFYQVAST